MFRSQFALLILAISSNCQASPTPPSDGQANLTAKAIMKGADGTPTGGEIVFTQINNGDTTVKVRVSGLPVGQGPKGLHILNSATCPPPGAANLPLANSIVHLNPKNSVHGARTASVRHLGDLGNVSFFPNLIQC